MPSIADVSAVVRGLNTTAKSLRLYPATSPIPRQSVEAACAALGALFATRSSLTLSVGRDSMEFRQDGEHAPVGGGELAEDLRRHGVADLSFEAGCTPEDLLALLGAVVTDPARLPGGFGTATSRVPHVRVSAVNLVVLDIPQQAEDEDFDSFLARLAADPKALAAWISAAANGDPAAMAEGLAEIGAAGAKAGLADFGASLAAAFGQLDGTGKDALFGLGIDETVARGLIGAMLRNLGQPDIAQGLNEGLYGKNMLSLSNALAKLPLADKLDSVIEEVRRMFPGNGHTSKEQQFLDHMLDVRSRKEPETALTTADDTYDKVARAADVSAEELAQAAAQAIEAGKAAAERSVRTILTLLDQQRDFDLYCRALDGLAAMVPGLLERGNPKLAAKVVNELASREARTTQPWPEVADRLRAALARATNARTMAALLRSAASGDPDGRVAARDILRHATEASQQVLLEAAMASGAEGIAAAESLVGRRMVDMLAAYAPRAQAAQLPAIVARLSVESEPRAVAAMDAVIRRPDANARREAAVGLGQAGDMNALRRLDALLRDSDPSVETAAIRSLGRIETAIAGRALAARLGELDIDGKDFEVGRELIGVLARHPSAEAEDALRRLAGRKTLIKRGRFAEVQDLARQALERRGGAR